MIPWNEDMFTSTQYLFNASTTWQYMVIAAGAMCLLLFFMWLFSKIMNDQLEKIVRKYVFNPLVLLCNIIIVIGVFFYFLVTLNLLWGVI